MAPSSPRSTPGSQGGIPLPPDALHEVLLRLPAKVLCRLRVVCRPWRCLLSDPHFIAAHAARHPLPLIVAGYDTRRRKDGIVCGIMDLSGSVVKRFHSTRGDERVRAVHRDFICLSKGRSFRLFNLATGAEYAVPEELAEEHASEERCTYFRASIAFGQVASTGDYKVLRVVDCLFNGHPGQLYEVFTLDGSSHARWRGKKALPNTVVLGHWQSVVINGIVYCFSAEFVQSQDTGLDRIASFDLETEEWRASLRGPLSSLVDTPDRPGPQLGTNDLSMAAMNGSLVVVHHCFSSMDLWFLMDFERGLWAKQHSILVQVSYWHYVHELHPLLVTNDGRIVLVCLGDDRGSLVIYNTRTNTLTDVAEMGGSCAVGLYTGSPLTLANGGS